MTRYNYTRECVPPYGERHEGYQEGVDRVLEYVEAIHAYPKLVAELKRAINEGII